MLIFFLIWQLTGQEGVGNIDRPVMNKMQICRNTAIDKMQIYRLVVNEPRTDRSNASLIRR